MMMTYLRFLNDTAKKKKNLANPTSPGMQTVWVVGNASEIQKTPTELSAGYFTFGGSVTGNVTDDPQVYEQFDHDTCTCPI
jgi:hypothetical protein